MEITSRIFCKKCNYKINANTGPWMMYWSLDNLAIPGYKEYSDIFKMRDELKKIHHNLHERLEEALYICDECKYFDNKLNKLITKQYYHNIAESYHYLRNI